MSDTSVPVLHRLADGRPSHRTPLRRLVAVFGAAIWWAMHLAALYWLVPRVCSTGSTWPLHVVTVVMFALCVRAWLSSLQVLRAGRKADVGERVGPDRDRYIGWLGVSFSVFFGVVVAVAWLSTTLIGLAGCA